jgi:hypothetical protein
MGNHYISFLGLLKGFQDYFFPILVEFWKNFGDVKPVGIYRRTQEFIRYFHGINDLFKAF